MNKAKPLTKEQIKSIVEEYKNGTRVKDISEIFGISPNTIWTHLRNLHVITRSRKSNPILSIEQVDQIKIAYMQGESTREIAKNFNVALSTITKTLKDTKVKLRNRGPSKGKTEKIKLSSEEKQKICQMYQEGLSITRISSRIGQSYFIVLKVLQSSNVKIRSAESYKTTYSVEPTKIEEISRLWSEGLSVHQLSLTFNLSRRVIKKALLSKNIEVFHRKTSSKSGKKLSSEQIEQVVNLCKQGYPVDVIAQNFNVSESTVIRVIKSSTGLTPKKIRAL